MTAGLCAVIIGGWYTFWYKPLRTNIQIIESSQSQAQSSPSSTPIFCDHSFDVIHNYAHLIKKLSRGRFKNNQYYTSDTLSFVAEGSYQELHDMMRDIMYALPYGIITSCTIERDDQKLLRCVCEIKLYQACKGA